MHIVFLPIYRFFSKHKALMYVLMAVTAVIFVVFGIRLNFEEDISKLLPSSSVESQMAFSSIQLKDKIYLQFASSGETLATDKLAESTDEFVDLLLNNDKDSRYIANILYKMEPEMALNALDFVLEHVPSFVDTSAYKAIGEALRPEAVERQMAANYELLMADETGDVTEMIGYDPLNLRQVILGDMMTDAVGGFNILHGHFFCADSTVSIAYLSPAFKSLDSKSARAFVKMLDETRKEFETLHPEVRVYAHGIPIGSVNNAGRIRSDLVLTVGISLILILILIWLCFHSFQFLLKMLIPIAYGAFFSLACVYWLQGGMSLMALGLGAIVLGVSISYCLHVLIHHFYTGDVETMLRDESTPVTLGCITTVGAFCSLLFTESELLRDFGLFASLGLLGSTFFVLVFLPHFMPRRKTDTNNRTFRVIARVNDLPFDRRRWFLVAITVFLIVGVVFSPKVTFDSDLRNLNYSSPAKKEAEQLFDRKNNDGFSHIYYATVSTDIDEALEANKVVANILDSLSKQGVVHSYSNLIPKLFITDEDQQRRIETWNTFWSDERKATAMRLVNDNALNLGLETYLFSDFQDIIDADYETASLIDSDVVPDNLLCNFIERNDDGQYMVFTNVAMRPDDKDKVTAVVVTNPKTFVLEPFYYCKDMVQLVHDDFNVAVWISSLFVLLILLVSFRNILTALLSFLPMVISWFTVQGYMALIGLQFNLINIIISTFIFGVGVDYSIFITEGLLNYARTGRHDVLTWHKVAIFFSAVILVIVVTSLLFAVHPAIRSIGLSTLIGMASTILISYSLQPFVFRKLMKIPFFRKQVLSRVMTDETISQK
mgnify:CR=1 FL=1